MSIFRRGRNAEEPETAAELPEEAGSATEDQGAEGEDRADASDESSDAADGDTGEARAQGPYDVSEVEDTEGRLDLGSLLMTGVPGMELRLEVDEGNQQVVGATAVLGDSAVQLQAFAAPKTMGIWASIRDEIAESIVGQGGTVDMTRGALGTELRTRMPSAGPDGRTVFAPARFVGVDGPRWFLRAVFSGRAAIDEEAAAPLMEVVRGTVVVRGDAAMAPRELLPLSLPQQPQDAAEEEEGSARSADDLNPFERGPEITEVR